MQRWCRSLGAVAIVVGLAVLSRQAVASDVGSIDPTDCAANEGSGAGASLLQVATVDRKAVVPAAVEANNTHPPEVAALFTAMAKAGAKMHNDLEVTTFMHGDYEVRGVRTTKNLAKGTKLLTIPKAMWMEGKLPEVMEGENRPKACKKIDDKHMLGQMLQVREEQRKGAKSKFYEFIQTIPTLEDYMSFYPSFADAELVQDFHGLSYIAESVKWDWQRFQDFHACIEALKEHVPFLHNQTLNDTMRLMAVATTRRYSLPHGRSTMMPVSDLWNTANYDDINTAWDMKGDNFYMTLDEPVKAGRELYDSYCTDCSNDVMLVTWGLLLADNPNPLTTEAKCSTLKAPTMAALGLSKGSALPSPASAKCKTTDGKRCSFAKLALEHCGKKWSGTSKASLLQEATASSARFQASARRTHQAKHRRLAMGGPIGSHAHSA